MENNERQQFEIDKLKLELEKQKLELEKARFQHASSGKNEPLISLSKNTPSVKLNILSLMAAVALAITPFLPWISMNAGGFGTFFSASANGFESGHGYYILLFSIAAIILVFLKNKFSFIPGVLAFCDGLSVVAGIGHQSASFMGATESGGFAIGPVVVIISSAVLIASSFIKFKPNSRQNNTEEYKIDKNELRKILPYIAIPIAILIIFSIINLITPLSILWIGGAELVYLGYISLFSKLLK
jgi:hypothetical protein